MSSWNVFLFKFLNLYKKNDNVCDWYMYYFWISIRFKKDLLNFSEICAMLKKLILGLQHMVE